MNSPKTITCPVCKGSGEIVRPVRYKGGLSRETQREIAIILKRERFSFREIGKVIGMKHAMSVRHLINTEQKKQEAE